MRYDRAFFDAGVNRRGTFCEKWDDPQAVPEGGLPLWVADMDFPCAAPIAQALRERAEHPCYGYNMENPADAQAVCAFWKRRHGLEMLPEQTRMLPCVVTGLRAAVRAFTAPGERVAFFTPVYGPFAASVRDNGRQAEAVPLLQAEDGRYQMNLPGMERALRAGVRLILLCNPHNPVSRLWTREELTALCRLAAEYEAVVVSDEIHADFAYAPGRFTPLLSLPEARERAVMLCSASKTFNIAGLQQATAVSFAPALLEKLERVCGEAGVTSGNTFALAATRAAYTACDDWLDGLLSYLAENRAALEAGVKRYLPRARLTPVEATYLAWLDLRAYGKSCDELTALFWKQGVKLSEGNFFGPEGEGFMRLNFGCPQGMIEEGLRRMARALEEE